MLDECLQGFYRFVIGLSKKVLIADVIGRTVDVALGGDLAAMDTGTAWVTITAYTMQLYFDFSGYSDMAIGLGRMMGFRFPENFDNPYTSASITEFWRRWHITLGAFMRNYLYIPLGGNRRGTARTGGSGRCGERRNPSASRNTGTAPLPRTGPRLHHEHFNLLAVIVVGLGEVEEFGEFGAGDDALAGFV